MVFVNDNEMNLKNYESISEDMKYVSNSLIRLKILATLYDGPMNMKEINEKTSLSYSSISGNMHNLELKGFVYRELNRYHLSNDMKCHMDDILELRVVINLLNEFFNILDGHIVDMIPNESVMELYLLGKAKLIESRGVDAYRTYNFIERCLSQSESVKCILPFYYEPFFEILKDLISQNKDVEILVPQNLLEGFQEKSDIETLVPFNECDSFLLIVTDNVMILGLFLENGNFDQNRLLTSKKEESLVWANNLFKNFKNENK